MRRQILFSGQKWFRDTTGPAFVHQWQQRVLSSSSHGGGEADGNASPKSGMTNASATRQPSSSGPEASATSTTAQRQAMAGPSVPKKLRLDENQGISEGIAGFGHYAGSISVFMDPKKEAARNQPPGPLPCEQAGAEEGQPIHEVPTTLTASRSSEEQRQQIMMMEQAAHAESMSDILQKGGRLPTPPRHGGGAGGQQLSAARKPPAFLHEGPLPASLGIGNSLSSPQGSGMAAIASPISRASPSSTGSSGSGGSDSSSDSHRLPSSPFATQYPSSLPRNRGKTITWSSGTTSSTTSNPTSAAAATSPPSSRTTIPPTSSSSSSSSSKPSAFTTVSEEQSAAAAAPPPSMNKEAEDYYRSLPQNTLSKEEMWTRIQAANADKNERLGRRKPTETGGGAYTTPSVASQAVTLDPHDVDVAKMEEELQETDAWHYQLGAYAFKSDGTEDNEVVARQRRHDYYTMWTLAMALNKARWNMLEVNAQRGVKTTGAGMKILFWKEAVRGILQSGSTSGATFTESHPVLRPFADVVSRHPKMTKAFVRGFTDARLRTMQQPANVQQLFDHFDKFYGYFYNSLLEVTHLQDEAAEHALLHIGRANGLTNHCVMFWKKYAALGVTLLPADMCADHCVHLGLLKRLSLASRDRAVRRLLCDVMAVAKTEMLQAEKLAKDIHPKTWPILMECFYPNYYLNFLQKRDFNVSAMFADYNIENMGFTWFRMKKRIEWQRTGSIEKLLSDAAPVPIINRPIFYRGSSYKMATPSRGSNSPGVKIPPSKLA